MASTTDIIFAVLYSTVLVFNVAGNCLVIYIISTNKVRKSATNYLLLNMSIADLFLGVFASQRYIVRPFLSPANQSCLFSLIATIGWIAAAASAVTMVILSFERYSAVCHPLRFRHIFTKRNVKVLIITAWLYGLLTNVHSIVHSQCRGPFHTTPQSIYDVFVWVYFIEGVVFFSLMITLVIKIIRTLSSSRITAKHVTSQASFQIRHKNRIKVTRAALLVIITFILCWIPQKSLCLLSTRVIPVNNPDVIHYGFTVSGVLVSINASVDPYLFSFQGSCFQSYLKKIICCACCEKRVVSIEKSSTTKRSETGTADTVYRENNLGTGH